MLLLNNLNMAEEKSLYQRTEELDEKLNRILGILENKTTQPNNSNVTVQAKPSNQQVLETFLKQSKKSWRWFGTKAEFQKAKSLAIFALTLLLFIGVFTTIISSICFNLYSTFSLFENIWMIFIAVELSYSCKAKYIYEVNDFFSHSSSKCTVDKVGMKFPNKEKKKYIVFMWFSFVSIIANVICIWTLGKTARGLATVFEVLFLAAMIFALFMYANLFAQYNIIWVEGLSLTTREKVVLAFPPGAKHLITEEEFKKQFPFFD